MAVKNIITLGIGAAPTSLMWFMTSGLGSAVEATATGEVPLTLRDRARGLTLDSRGDLTLNTRTRSLTLEDRP